MSERRFTYRALGPERQPVSDTLTAESRADALSRLSRERKVVLDLRETDADGGAGKKVSRDVAWLALRQLAVMTRAGIDLLEALDIIAAAMPGEALSSALRATIASLRQGNRLAAALQSSAPFYPSYVYALIRAGEATGRLPLVLEEAARQMAFEHRVGRDIQNALFYPAFLVVSGVGSVGFLFYVVVPRFALMLRNTDAAPTGLSAFVLNTGVAFHDHFALIGASLLITLLAMAGFLSKATGQRTLGAVAHATPGLRILLRTRERASWSRIMALALAAGVDVLQATSLAAGAAPDGPIKRGALDAIARLRAGQPVDEAFRAAGALSPIDASLIRAGQRSGALSEMFRAVADRNEEEMRDAIKRFTSILEPAAIGAVAGMIGLIVLGLVSALASIYDSIG